MTRSAGWAEAISANAAAPRTARRLIPRLQTLHTASLAFCRLLEGWARGKPMPPTAEGRASALQDAAERVAEALGALAGPLERYLLELEPEAEGASWFGEPGAAELVDWEPVLARAGVVADPNRVTAAYLELAVLVRALEGLSSAVEFQAAPDPSSLWAGLFDLRENLLGRAQDDIHALAA